MDLYLPDERRRYTSWCRIIRPAIQAYVDEPRFHVSASAWIRHGWLNIRPHMLEHILRGIIPPQPKWNAAFLQAIPNSWTSAPATAKTRRPGANGGGTMSVWQLRWAPGSESMGDFLGLPDDPRADLSPEQIEAFRYHPIPLRLRIGNPPPPRPPLGEPISEAEYHRRLTEWRRNPSAYTASLHLVRPEAP